MAIDEKNTSYRIYLVAFGIFLMAIGIVVKLCNIQWVEGDHYRQLAKERTVRNFVIPANRGNVYSADGSLLATSIPNYDVRFDALAPKGEDFNEHVSALADSLGLMFGKPSSFYDAGLRRARGTKNRYYLIAKGLSYTEYIRVKSFPLFSKGPFKGGIITEQYTVREHPIGMIAKRTIGYDQVRKDGKTYAIGLEKAYKKYLDGKDGRVLKQKIAKGQWKPIRDQNEVDPQDGYDIISTIDVYIQDIAHHALLKQLQEYEADHGCVVVMETKTGYIKAIANLGRASKKDSTYFETINYAISESHEPGSTYKLADLMALLEDGKADTSDVYDSRGGDFTIRGKHVRDSHKGGYGKISLGRGFEVSSNTVLVQAVYEAYKDDPMQFINRLKGFGLDKKLNLPFEGEGTPFIPEKGGRNWSHLAMPWAAFGYGVSITPLQTLTYYNAVANNGEMVRPQFVSEIREWNRTIKKFDKQVINPKICSEATLKKLRACLENVVEKGTGRKLYSKNFPMAGKTGTAQVNYNSKDGSKMHYVSSFAGYFPADNPKYTCIVVVHEPNTSGNNYYGADVAGPVFKRIAQKIYTDAPSLNSVKNLDGKNPVQEKKFNDYYAETQKVKPGLVPDVKGMSGMDAVALLGNLGVKVKVVGNGKVKKQSVQAGAAIRPDQVIILELSS